MRSAMSCPAPAARASPAATSDVTSDVTIRLVQSHVRTSSRSYQLVGIHRRITSWRSSTFAVDLLSPFAMYAPLARSDYYEDSATP